MKTIYVVEGCMDWEGGHPLRAFISKQRAEDFEKSCKDDEQYDSDYFVITELQFDEVCDEGY